MQRTLTRTTTQTPPPLRFRPDIEGLRAVAVLAVLGYHARVPGFGGGFVGVDVFFVISGFLITARLIQEHETTGSISLSRFYAKRIRRLLPASAASLVMVAVLTLVVLPVNRWASIASDILASAIYLVNWRFAAQAVDYLAQDAAASPVLHFWSLSIEEQFYAVWPLLILAVGLVASRRGLPVRRAALVVLATVATLSLAHSIAFTAADGGRAYFVTTTRVWELALGGLLVLGLESVRRLTPAAAPWLGVAGITAVILAIVAYSDATPFPAATALLPTVGTVAVIAAGTVAPEAPIGRLLSVRPALVVGALSYSLYLFHFPFIVVADVWFPDGPGWIGSAAVIASAVPAWLSYRFVEAPIRRIDSLVRRSRRGLLLGLALTAMSATAALTIFAVIEVREAEHLGRALGPSAVLSTAETGTDVSAGDVPEAIPADLRPPLSSAGDDVPVVYALGCHHERFSTDLQPCVFGDPSGPLVALVGDSHAAQWVPALREIAATRGWRLETFTKSSCPYAEMRPALEGEPNDACVEFNDTLTDRLLAAQPRLVITTSSNEYVPFVEGRGPLAGAAGQAAFTDGLEESVATLLDAGIDVVLIADTPRPDIDVPDCLGRLGEVAACTVSRTDATVAPLQASVADRLPRTLLVDMTDSICTTEDCPPIVGTTLVWRDSHHLTATYSRSLAATLETQLPPP